MRIARYTDGTLVREGDRIRYHQAPGGMLPHGDWRYGIAARQRAADPTDPELYLLEDGRLYNLVGHVVERADR